VCANETPRSAPLTARARAMDGATFAVICDRAPDYDGIVTRDAGDPSATTPSRQRERALGLADLFSVIPLFELIPIGSAPDRRFIATRVSIDLGEAD